MNAHRWNLAGLIVLISAIAIDQPVVAKIFRLRRSRTMVAHNTSPLTPIVDLDATTCGDEPEVSCDCTDSNIILDCSADLCEILEPVATKTILGDMDDDGTINLEEASSVLTDGALKDALFAMPLADQKEYLLTFDTAMQTQIARLADTHGTWKWRFAVKAAGEMGLTATEAAAIAVAWLY
jgi:hypothetical protein